VQAGRAGEQRRLCHRVLVSFHFFAHGMREEYQHLDELTRNGAKWLIVGPVIWEVAFLALLVFPGGSCSQMIINAGGKVLAYRDLRQTPADRNVRAVVESP
jgi:hypothetical protein